MTENITLASIKKKMPAKIIGFTGNGNGIETRLREIGFAEGDVVEILHRGLFGKSPLNVRLHGTSIAIRPAEAATIIVEPVLSASEKVKMRLDEQRKLNEDGNCCGACNDD